MGFEAGRRGLTRCRYMIYRAGVAGFYMIIESDLLTHMILLEATTIGRMDNLPEEKRWRFHRNFMTLLMTSYREMYQKFMENHTKELEKAAERSEANNGHKWYLLKAEVR